MQDSPLTILPTAGATCQHGNRCWEGEVKSGGGKSGSPEGEDHIRRTDSHPLERTKALASWRLCLI